MHLNKNPSDEIALISFFFLSILVSLTSTSSEIFFNRCWLGAELDVHSKRVGARLASVDEQENKHQGANEDSFPTFGAFQKELLVLEYRFARKGAEKCRDAKRVFKEDSLCWLSATAA
ncbi:hypothetical protein TNCT_323661 [Trichonephila clavata]|uniref:Uncharacterized protein n=1 Tax=Trichonephila clavata TaxID=2740835 RepID=A0A8X6M4Q6_TRICU|nr:hypothetical protein TNCT_323661 [Trichonephila clavata]